MSGDAVAATAIGGLEELEIAKEEGRECKTKSRLGALRIYDHLAGSTSKTCNAWRSPKCGSSAMVRLLLAVPSKHWPGQ